MLSTNNTAAQSKAGKKKQRQRRKNVEVVESQTTPSTPTGKEPSNIDDADAEQGNDDMAPSTTVNKSLPEETQDEPPSLLLCEPTEPKPLLYFDDDDDHTVAVDSQKEKAVEVEKKPAIVVAEKKKSSTPSQSITVSSESTTAIPFEPDWATFGDDPAPSVAKSSIVEVKKPEQSRKVVVTPPKAPSKSTIQAEVRSSEIGATAEDPKTSAAAEGMTSLAGVTPIVEEDVKTSSFTDLPAFQPADDDEVGSDEDDSLLSREGDAPPSKPASKLSLSLLKGGKVKGDIKLLKDEDDTPHELEAPSLWDAVLASDLEAVKLEVARGADVDEMDDDGRTPLMVSCALGAADVVTYLLTEVKPPANIEAKALEGWTPLMIACGSGNAEVVKILAENGADLDARDARYGSTALLWACGGGHYAVIKYLVQEYGGRGALVQARNKQMWTPLMVAAEGGQMDAVRFLVSRCASLDDFNNQGKTALDLAVTSGATQVEAFLRKIKARTGRDFWAALLGGDVETVSAILKTNPHMTSVKDVHGRPPLLLACLQGHIDLAEYLVNEAGADVNDHDPAGTTALDVAAVTGNIPLTRFLVSCGKANLAARNSVGWTPLMHAVGGAGELEVLRLLVDAGAQVNACNETGDTVLDVAMKAGRAEASEYLASKGAFAAVALKKRVNMVTNMPKTRREGFHSLW